MEQCANPIRWGIVGPGRIAGKFAVDLRVVPGARLVAVAGRDSERARSFAQRNAVERAHRDIHALAADQEVDMVYVASPHNAHAEAVRILLQAGKSVLCEKPFTVNAREARSLVEFARERRLFLMEAMWTRFLPVHARVMEWLAEGRIGHPKVVSSAFCVRMDPDPQNRWFNPALAGGSLLDLGVYCLAATQRILGRSPLDVSASARMARTGVDEWVAARLTYGDGAVASFTCGLSAVHDNSLVIGGELGYIRVPPVFIRAATATLHVDGNEETVHEAFRSGGFEYQIEEAMRCFRAGEVESPLMPHADTLDTMETMDRIRGQIGLRYPGEIP